MFTIPKLRSAYRPRDPQPMDTPAGKGQRKRAFPDCQAEPKAADSGRLDQGSIPIRSKRAQLSRAGIPASVSALKPYTIQLRVVNSP
jgi:hypothetical protein